MSSPGIRVDVIGTTAVEAHIDDFTERLHAALVRVANTLTLDLWQIVVNQNLAGAVLKRRTGALARAQQYQVTDNGKIITGSVGFNRVTVPYGVYHEFGVPHEWIIVAKKAKALRFSVGGKFIFRKKVTHPPLPERSFLRAALAQIAPRVEPEIRAAIAQEAH